MKFIVIDNVNGAAGTGNHHDHIIHAADCKDREVRNAPRSHCYEYEAENVGQADLAFREDFYSDFEQESREMFSADWKPCCFPRGTR